MIEMAKAIGLVTADLTQIQLFEIHGAILQDPAVTILIRANLDRLLNGSVLPSGSRLEIIRKLMDDNDRAELRSRIAARVNLPPSAMPARTK
jgi:hypothetical protein